MPETGMSLYLCAAVYALVDGIRRILSPGTFSPPEMPPASLQMELTLGLMLVFYHRQVRSHCRKAPPSFCEVARSLALALFTPGADTG